MEGLADTIAATLRAPEYERAAQMELLRLYPIAYDTFTWAGYFLLALDEARWASTGLDHGQDAVGGSDPWPFNAGWELSDPPNEEPA